MNLKYYASPSDLLDDKTTSPIILHENNGKILTIKQLKVLFIVEKNTCKNLNAWMCLYFLVCCSLTSVPSSLPKFASDKLTYTHIYAYIYTLLMQKHFKEIQISYYMPNYFSSQSF